MTGQPARVYLKQVLIADVLFADQPLNGVYQYCHLVRPRTHQEESVQRCIARDSQWRSVILNKLINRLERITNEILAIIEGQKFTRMKNTTTHR